MQTVVPRRIAEASILKILLILCIVVTSLPARSQLTAGPMNVHWDEGTADCSRAVQPPLQVHAYNARTFIIRENLCATFEAPFMYLLVGSGKALLIGTGDLADPKRMPLRQR